MTALASPDLFEVGIIMALPARRSSSAKATMPSSHTDLARAMANKGLAALAYGQPLVDPSRKEEQWKEKRKEGKEKEKKTLKILLKNSEN